MDCLRKVVMCRPALFEVIKPVNAIQWLYRGDGLFNNRADDSQGIPVFD